MEIQQKIYAKEELIFIKATIIIKVKTSKTKFYSYST